MRNSRVVLVEVALAGTLAVGGCGGGRGGAGNGGYATQRGLDSVWIQLVATHDTMRALWKATDSMSKVLSAKKDTTPSPCPPRCLYIVPPIPGPIER
jgi:hypothetical protein